MNQEMRVMGQGKAVQKSIRKKIQHILDLDQPTALTALRNRLTVEPGLVSKAEAARILRIRSRTLDDCIAAKYVDVARVDGRPMVSVRSLNRLLKPHPKPIRPRT